MIELTDWLRKELVARAAAEDPYECCGLISRADPARGLPEGGIALWAAENAAEDPSAAFEIAPDNLLAIVEQIAKRGETLAGVYHSHPHGAAAPSTEDITTATNWPGLTWIIVGKERCGLCIGTGESDENEIPCEACDGGAVAPAFWTGVLA